MTQRLASQLLFRETLRRAVVMPNSDCLYGSGKCIHAGVKEFTYGSDSSRYE
jgi:hypothetical protein